MTPQEQLDWYNTNSYGITFRLDDHFNATVNDTMRELLATFEGHTFNLKQIIPLPGQHTGKLFVSYGDTCVRILNLATWADPLRIFAAMHMVWMERATILGREHQAAARNADRLGRAIYGDPFDMPRYCDPKLKRRSQTNAEVNITHEQDVIAYGTIDRHHDTPTEVREGWTQDGPTWNLIDPHGSWSARITEPPSLPGLGVESWTWVLRTADGERTGKGPSLRYAQNVVEDALWEVVIGLEQ
jgi:hypothetical protein